MNLGFITPNERTKAQEQAHNEIVSKMPKFAIAAPEVAGPVNVRLFDFWKNADVVADVGFVFPRFHQLTGSCVGAGGGQALFSLIAVQRCIADSPTKAFLPFWPFNYGRSRYYMGDRSPGEGSMGSTFAKSLKEDGVISASEQGLPQFKNADGLVLTESLEMQWSDGDSITVTKWEDLAHQHPLGTAAEVRSVEEIRAAIINGYPVTFACNNYIGNASVQGSGADAAVVGRWDGSGGHQQSIHAVWDNPTLGTLYWAQNNWPGSSYPADPAGGPVCGCWVKERDVTAALRLDSEVFALSHLNWFPAQPKVLHWLV